MKKIFIHAGPGKTGTSTIQHWLSRNVDFLAETASGNLYDICPSPYLIADRAPLLTGAF